VQNSLFQENVKWKAVKYIRLSDDDKDTQDLSNSVINQGKIIGKFALNDSSISIVDTYIDDGYTGTNLNRPAFKNMLEEIENENINCIIVKSLARLGRSQDEVCNLVQRYFPTKGVRFISIKERLDTYRDKKRLHGFEFPMLAFMNEIKPMDTSTKTRTSLEVKRSRGLYVGSFLPYGYLRSKDNKNKLVIDERTKDNVILIFSLYINGKSLSEIAEELNSRGILSPMGYFAENGLRKMPKHCNVPSFKSWRTKHIKKILSCEIYTGDMVQGTTTSFSYKVSKRIPLPREKWIIIKNTHEPIISHTVFDNVNKVLSKMQKPVTTRNTKPSIFAGYLYCGDCKKPMVRNIKRVNGKQYKKFLCSNFKKNGVSVCTSHYVDESVIHDVVLFSLQHQIGGIEDINNVLSKITLRKQADSSVAYLEKERMLVISEINQLDKLVKESYVDYKDGILNEKEYINIKTIISTDRDSLNMKLKHIEIELPKAKNMKLKYNEYINEFIEYKNIRKLNRSIIVSLIERIYVDDKKGIKVIFKHQDELQKIRSIFA